LVGRSVKHFAFEERGKRRLHARRSASRWRLLRQRNDPDRHAERRAFTRDLERIAAAAGLYRGR
jgi:hypothetical protein